MTALVVLLMGCIPLEAPPFEPAPTPDSGLVEPFNESFEPAVEVYGEALPDLDSDLDGLSDQKEMEFGTDPHDPDTDDDGYSDFDEVMAGSDPVDELSVIYQGNWPFNANKNDVVDPGWGQAPPELGSVMPDFVGLDQHGDWVHLYDFANDGKPVVLQLSDASSDLSDHLFQWVLKTPPPMKMMTPYEDIQLMIEQGAVHWIHILVLGAEGDPTKQEYNDWLGSYPDCPLPLLRDAQHHILPHIGGDVFPVLVLLNEDMLIQETDPNDYTLVLDALLAELHSN